MSRVDKDLWQIAIDEEMAALQAKKVYTESTLPEDATAVPSKLVLDIKGDEQGNVEKYKARLVAKGFHQVPGRDCDEVFAPTAQHVTLRVLLAIACAQRFAIHQLDVRTAFLNDELSDPVYIRLPKELGGNIWLLHKALYGLKQAARVRHATLRQKMLDYGPAQSQNDPCLFIPGSKSERVYVLIHVDDALVIGQKSAVKQAKEDISTMFDIKDIGMASYFLGTRIQRTTDGGYSLSQQKYTEDVLARFNMTDAKQAPTPLPVGLRLSKNDGKPLPSDNQYQALVGSVIYLSINSRPDISHAVGILSRFMSCPTTTHWEASKHLLRYLKGSSTLALSFAAGQNAAANQGVHACEMSCEISCEMFTDADFAADVDKRRSTSGAVMPMQGAAVLWISKLQSTVATSTTEAEYVAASTATKEGLWVRKLLGEIYRRVSPLHLRVDNQAAIVLISEYTAGQSGRTKHIDVQFHFVRDRFQKGDISVGFVSTSDQHADIFTKQLAGSMFEKHRSVVMGKIGTKAYCYMLRMRGCVRNCVIDCMHPLSCSE
jgi:hypothetical protein